MTADIAPYRPRLARFRDVWTVGGWRLKRYSIVRDGEPDWAAYDDVWPLVHDVLPHPAAAPGRAGVGFVIAHRGAGVHYVVLGWWDNGNEMPLRVFVKSFTPDSSWRPAHGGESVCVWDLRLIWFEREAYVRHVMADAGPDLDVYLAQRYDGDV